MSAFLDELQRCLAEHWTISREQAALLEAHFERLQLWSRTTNLTSMREPREIAAGLYAESVVMAKIIPADVRTIVDLGSGAGFPGVPIATCRPESLVTLVEADLKKSIFLQESTRDLPNCIIRRDRVEQVTGEWDCLASRAVAWRDVLPAVLRLARSVVLLVSERQLTELTAETRIVWRDPVHLAWTRGHLALFGTRAADRYPK